MDNLQLITAVKDGDVAAVRALIEAGADVGQQDEHGWTPLNWAAGKGDLEIARLLVENGADVFKVGRDQRTPYMIALAAGRVELVKFLRQAEDDYPGEKKQRQERPYCKAYHLKDLRLFPAWSESRINWKEKNGAGKTEAGGEDEQLSDDNVVFIHQDFTVTESMWHSENVIFNQVNAEWEEFCSTALNFRAPGDIDYIVPAESR